MVDAHREFLRRVLKGCLLSRKVRLLRALMDLKSLAHHYAALSARLSVDPATLSLDADGPETGTVCIFTPCLPGWESGLEKCQHPFR